MRKPKEDSTEPVDMDVEKDDDHIVTGDLFATVSCTSKSTAIRSHCSAIVFELIVDPLL